MLDPNLLEGLLFFVGVFFGVFGSALRMSVQRYRDGEWPHKTNEGLYNELFLGGAAGLLLWLTALFPDWRALALAAAAGGFAAVDTIENMLTKKT